MKVKEPDVDTKQLEDIPIPTEEVKRQPVVAPGMVLPLIAITCCFVAWGIANDMTTPMVAGFRHIFEMTNFQASFVQMAFYGAYFVLALPAAFIIDKLGYRVGLIIGALLAAVGAFSFYPASHTMAFGAFLVAIFAMAAGCSILETSANPYVLSLGPKETATRRLNLVQCFNPVGTNIGALLAATLIMPTLDAPVTPGSNPREVRAQQLQAVMGPYIMLGIVLVLIAICLWFQRVPTRIDNDLATKSETTIKDKFRKLWQTKRYRYGVPAQFCNTGAQVCCWTYIIHYTQQVVHGSLELGTNVLQISLLIFLVSRFIMTWIIGRIHASKALVAVAFSAVVLCMFAILAPSVAGLVAVVMCSACLSLMFPTIYGVALGDLGDAAKFGSAGLVMAIVGGAIMPMLQGRLMDSTSAATSFIVPAVCFAMVGLYAIYDLRAPASDAARDNTDH